MTHALAVLPLLLFVLLLVWLRSSAAIAGLASAALALVVAIAAFDYPLSLPALLGPLAEAVFVSAAILWIIFPALGIYEFQTRTGANEAIGQWLASISSKPQIDALLIAWFFGLFLEGAAGFGTPIALVAPMLVALGFSPLRALVMALFGHAAGVSFGAVGTPMVPLLEAAPVDPTILSLLILLPHAALAGLLLAIIFRLARPEEGERASPLWVPVAVACFFLPAAALAWFAGPELPTLGGALIGALVFIALVRRKRTDRFDTAPAAGTSLLMATLPYLLVLALILLTRLIAPLETALQGTVVSWRIGEDFEGSVAPFYHPGTMLFLALVASALLLRRIGTLEPSLRKAAARLPLVAFALVAVLLLARLMVHSGMIEGLARGASELLGTQWPIAAPIVGSLGSFVTGSATASNIILADFQIGTAAAGSFVTLIPLAGQGFGSAIGNIIAPHNIIAGAATVGLVGREGEVLKRTLPICILYAGLGGVILYAVGRLL